VYPLSGAIGNSLERKQFERSERHAGVDGRTRELTCWLNELVKVNALLVKENFGFLALMKNPVKALLSVVCLPVDVDSCLPIRPGFPV
jgi:hypothetical protein